ncbi:helix-turn-helix transcriptional regulator [Micrococcus luteus]|uniref:helix-turn-helix transcriptional regulator n=1 Tax=Micrococcus luteus TaxID=1270 RepID=UPI0024B0952E|nr:helix-turn-helix transcriptional regulator [Micrococcus luteus]
MPRDPCEELTAALAAQAAAERRLHHAVHRARESGWTWEEIAQTLGVSRQAAHRRFQTAADPGAAPTAGAAPQGGWPEAARRSADRAVRAWFTGDLTAMHALMTSTARRPAADRAAADHAGDPGPRRSVHAPADLTVHELDGVPLPTDPHAAGSRRAVVVRGVAEAERADPVVHVLLGPRGRVSGVSIRLGESLEVWPL